MSASASGFYITGGTLRHDAASYVERQADRDLLQGLRRGEFCYVLTSRQMGKSSLMVRTATKLREEGAQVVVLDLTAIGQNLTPEQWYDGLLVRMAGQLGLEDELDDFWAAHPRLSPVQRFFQALRDVVLARRSGPVVIFVDEIDVVRSLKFQTDEFFAAIRECYNRRTEAPAMSRVTFCLLGVAAPSELIQDTRTTPFNIGRRVELNDFTAEEALPLARGLAMMSEGEGPARAALARVLHWTSGHPYLTQRLCQALAARPVPARGDAAVDAVCAELFLSHRAREQDDNLLFVRERLLRSEVDLAGLLTLYVRVQRGRLVPDDAINPLAGVLRLAGIVRPEAGRLRVRNRIYARVFDAAWIQAHMPDAEWRRQRAAFNRGVVRTTAIAAVVVAALAVAVCYALQQAAHARRALAQSNVSQAQARRVSGLAGQRHESLAALRRATRDHADQAALRDEAIACLAVFDLKRTSVSTNSWTGASAVALGPGLAHLAMGDAEGAIEVRRTHDDGVTARLPAAGLPVAWLALSPDGHYVAAQYSDQAQHRFVVWNVPAGRPVLERASLVHPGALDFSADNAKVAVAFGGADIEVFSLPEGRREVSLPLRQVTGIPREPRCVRFDEHALRLAEAAPDSQIVQVWNLKNQAVIPLFHRSEITALAWSPDGQHLAASGSSDLSLWDLEFLRRRDLAQAHADVVQDLLYNAEGTLLASLGADRVLNLWCPVTGRRVAQALEVEPLLRLSFSPDGRRLGLAGPRTGLRTWSVEGVEEYRVFRAPSEINAPLTSIAFDPEGRVLVGSSDLGLSFWDTAHGRTLAPLALHSVRCVGVHPRNGSLFTSTPHGLSCWPRRVAVASGRVELRFGPPQSLDLPLGLERCSFASEGKQAVVVHGEQLRQFQIDAPFATAELPFQGSFQALALSPDARWLATWCESESLVKVWSMESSKVEKNPVASFPAGPGLAFAPDSRHLLAGVGHGYQIWDTGTWAAVGAPGDLAYNREAGGSIALARLAGDGGTLLAVSREPGLLQLFEFSTKTGAAPMPRLLANLESPDRKRVEALTFNPQGSRLAAACADHVVQVWDLARVQRALAGMGLGAGLPTFVLGSDAPLTVTFEASPSRATAAAPRRRTRSPVAALAGGEAPAAP